MQANKVFTTESLSFWEAILDSLPNGILLIDEARTVCGMNQQGSNLLGFTLDRPGEIQFDNVVTSPGDDQIGYAFKYAFSDNKDYTQYLPISLLTKNQEMIVVSEIRCIKHSTGLMLVVTIEPVVNEQVTKLEAARQSKIKSAISDACLDTLITINLDDEIVDFNDAGLTTFGWRKDEVLGKKMHELFVPEHLRSAHKKGLEHYRQTREGPLLGKRVEIEAMHRDGHLIPVELGLVPIELENEHLVTAFVRDISEVKKAQLAIIAEKEKALAASAAKSRFLSHMSHEIRSPLNALLGGIELLKDTLENDQQEHFYQLARSSGESLLSIINEVLDFSKIESGHVEIHKSMTRLGELMDLSLIPATVKCPENILLFGLMDDRGPNLVEIDAVKTRQIITVLLDNAFKFTTKGSVTLEMSVHASQQHELGHELKIAIQDSGVGISQEQQKNIFLEFEQADPIRDTGYGGTGLGLTIAKNLVEIMDGQIGVSSSKNLGTEFVVTIPCKAITDGLNNSSRSDWPNIGVLGRGKHLYLFVTQVISKDFNTKPLNNVVNCPDKTNLVEWIITNEIKTLIIDKQIADTISETELRQINIPILIVANTFSNDQKHQHKTLVNPVTSQGLKNTLIEEDTATLKSAEASPAHLNKQPSFAGLHVLLVEDMIANRLVAKAMLNKKGIQVTEANDGLEALHALENNTFDLILMDMRMPRMNGLEATEKIRASATNYADIPIIALTANAEKSEVERCRSAGVNAFVSKPFELPHLLAEISKYVG